MFFTKYTLFDYLQKKCFYMEKKSFTLKIFLLEKTFYGEKFK